MQPARYDTTFVAGDTFPMTLTYVDEDVLGGSAVMHIRARAEETPVITAQGSLGSNGVIVFELPPEATRSLDSARDGLRKFLYNIQLTNSQGFVQTLLVGELRVMKDLAVT